MWLYTRYHERTIQVIHGIVVYDVRILSVDTRTTRSTVFRNLSYVHGLCLLTSMKPTDIPRRRAQASKLNLTIPCSQEYAKLYIAGDKAHQAEEHENTTLHMEAALEAYWTALQDCRAMCDEPFDQGWFPDFVSSIASECLLIFGC